MINCPYCGVELDNNVNICPLCNTPVKGERTDAVESKEDSFYHRKENSLADNKQLTKKQNRKLFWELSVIILVSCLTTTLLIDLLTSNSITWSKYSIVICLALFILVSLLSFLRHHPLVSTIISFVTLSLLLLLFDKFSFNADWGTKLGIPIISLFYITIIALTLLIKITKNHGLNLLGYFFICCGFISAGIESILDKYFSAYIELRWSLFVIISIIPIALILFFIHYRLKKGRELRRLFHI